MKDLFELRGVDAEVSIPKLGKKFQLHDPNQIKKILIHKAFVALDKIKNEMDSAEFSEKAYALNVEQIKLYLPELTDDDFERLGGSEFYALLRQITNLAEAKFGAVVTKIGEGDAAGKS